MLECALNSDAEAGIILRFHDADNYLVALYSPLLKAQSKPFHLQYSALQSPGYSHRVRVH